jgi:hypothetical protein
MAHIECSIMGSHFPKIRRIIAPANKLVLYSLLFNLQMSVCQQPHVSASGGAFTPN